VPILFFGATPFNLLGLDRWVRNFTYITYYDAWGRRAPAGVHASDKPYQEFESGEDINNWLPDQPRGPRAHRCRDTAGYPTQGRNGVLRQRDRGDLPGTRLRPDPARRPACAQHLDSKIVTTQLGNEAGAPSVPNVLTSVDDWAGLQAPPKRPVSVTNSSCRRPTATPARPTFLHFVGGDWKKHSADIVGEEIKVMRRINNRPGSGRGGAHPVRNHRRTVHVRADRLQAAHPFARRLVWQRNVPGGADR
jgi:hypothetical protein